MTAITYVENRLHVENVNVTKIVEKTDTPVYCYSLALLTNNFNSYKRIPKSLICFAVKANSNLSLLRAICRLDGGADVVSEGEARLALAAGIPPDKIVFSGVGKTVRELEFAVTRRFHQINVESIQELELLNDIAKRLKIVVDIAVRLNPNIDASTHVYNTTGLLRNKFGIPSRIVENFDIRRYENVRCVGVSCHIGSGIDSLDIVTNVINFLKKTAVKLRNLGWPIRRFDVGGGLGISYSHAEYFPSVDEYAERVINEFEGFDADEIICEPGRSIVAKCGILITKVLYTKENDEVTHVIVDAGMNDLIRPAMYGITHQILPVTRNDTIARINADIVGPVCESSDTFASNYRTQSLKSGDLLAICDTGAYGVSLSSNYNARLTPPEVLVKGGEFDVVRQRGTYEELLSRTQISKFVE